MYPPSDAAEPRAPRDPSTDRARRLLIEALEVIDAADLPPEIGARLQHVIDSLDEAGPARADVR